MQNKILPNNQINFKANVSKEFLSAGSSYLAALDKKAKLTRFLSKSNEFKNYGSDDMHVFYKRIHKDNKKQYVLYVNKDKKESFYDDSFTDNSAILTIKDNFRKVVEKFIHINRHEFNLKTQKLK